MRKVASVAAVLAFVGMTPSAFAGSSDPLVPSLDPWLSVNVGATTGADLLPSTANEGSNDFSFSGDAATGQYTVNWDLMMNPDPYIDGIITITNLSGSAQNFTVNLMLPVTPAFSPGLMGGSIDATVYDTNNSGSATLQPSTSPNIYFGRIDGANVLPMFAQNVTCIGVGCSLNSGESQMPPSIPVAGGVNTSIGTRLVFNLSAGDKVAFNTHFEVTPVPLPASAWLLLSGLGAMFGLGRRKRA